MAIKETPPKHMEYGDDVDFYQRLFSFYNIYIHYLYTLFIYNYSHIQLFIYKYIMSVVYKYKIYCVTESTYVEGWGTTPPTHCYNNNTHTVNANSIQLLETLDQNTVSIKEDKVDIGRNVYVKSIEIEDVAFGDTGTAEYIFPLVTSMYSFKFLFHEQNIGDTISIYANPDTTMGLITSNLSVGATVIGAPPALMMYGWPGFHVNVTDGVNNDHLGIILSMDKVNNTITVQTPTEHSFSSTNTVIKMTIRVCDEMKIGGTGYLPFGEDVIGGSALPPTTKARFIYKNNSTSGDPKFMCVYLTLLF